MGTSPLMFDGIVIYNVMGESILDVGCGYGKWGFLLKKYYKPTRKERPRICGIDIYEPYIDILKKEQIYDEVQAASACDMPYPDKSFDTVIACEIIEHLTKEDQVKFMAEIKRIAKQCFIVTTPNFPDIRGGQDTIYGHNEYDAHHHICGYDEFKSYGFTQVIGLGRLKIGSWSLSNLLSPLGVYFPRLSRYLMGFWFADGKRRSFSTEY